MHCGLILIRAGAAYSYRYRGYLRSLDNALSHVIPNQNQTPGRKDCCLPFFCLGTNSLLFFQNQNHQPIYKNDLTRKDSATANKKESNFMSLPSSDGYAETTFRFNFGIGIYFRCARILRCMNFKETADSLLSSL